MGLGSGRRQFAGSSIILTRKNQFCFGYVAAAIGSARVAVPVLPKERMLCISAVEVVRSWEVCRFPAVQF
jgi:hypothetical protein